jgi:outer membrane immunogenic protein
MKKLAIAITAVAAFTGSAVAADMPVKARYIAPVATAYNWTGCYVGAGGGYGMWNQDNQAFNAAGVALELQHTDGGRGWFGTGQVGCDYQFAPKWVVGAFGDFDVSDIKGTMTLPGILCVPKTSSALISRKNRLTSAHHDRAAVFRNGRLGRAIQVEEPA